MCYIVTRLYNKKEPYHTTIDNIHKLGLWHQTFACWLVDKNEQIIYLQLRGPKNRVGANTFDATASGHLSHNEIPEDGFRELKELRLLKYSFSFLANNFLASANDFSPLAIFL